ncbi:mobilization protein MbpA [Maribacter sp. 1_MG-2023]|uniref:mobilization protein MbpA n=1 Tax=Maribacter sp. 1_MG-2023 TaxID=3062677 RepID=UPI0026E2C70A|nr:mobilization protein MbpA [Maribacter sp. 1_MG-2023]MDO6470250.1 mobilization protein MbpA [Maribacter sp. 1_MG-2023]
MRKKARVITKFRCTIYEKKLLKIKAKKSGLSLSEFCFRAAFNKEITARLTEEEIEAYKTISTFSRNFTLIGNMFRKRNPQLSHEVYALSKELKEHLNKFKK